MATKTDSLAGSRMLSRAAPSARPTRSADAEATQEAGEETTLTRAEVAEMLKQAKAENYQQTQSLLDQLGSRQSKQLKAALEPVERTLVALAKSGVKIDDDTADRIRSQARVDALAAPGGAFDDDEGFDQQIETNGRTSSAQRRDSQPTLGHLILQLMQQRGVFVLDSDAEAKLIDVTEQNPQKLLAMADKAINTKIARLAGVETPADQTETDAVPVQSGPGPNLKGKGSKGTKILPEGEPMDYLAAGYKESPEFPQDGS